MKFLRDKERLQALIRETKDKEFGEVEISSIRLKKSGLTPEGLGYSTVKEISFTY